MRQDLLDSQRRLHDSLFELYMQGGFELMLLGTRGLKRELIIDLETSALTPEKGEIIHYYAVNRWDEDDEFDEPFASMYLFWKKFLEPKDIKEPQQGVTLDEPVDFSRIGNSFGSFWNLSTQAL